MKKLIITIIWVGISACAEKTPVVDPPASVLEPVEDTVEVPTPPPDTSAAPATLEALKVQFGKLGYDGIGLEHEDESLLQMLLVVFKDPAAANRKIRSVYTGGAMEYDGQSETLTIGGTKDAKSILAFLKKKVPLRKKP